MNTPSHQDEAAETVPPMPLLQSPNWNRFKDTSGPIHEVILAGEGFPRYTSQKEQPIIFTIIDAVTGERIDAYVDDSRQYSSEGRQWRRTGNRELVDKYHVAAWIEKGEDNA